MTLLASRLIVLITQPPQPSSKLLPITRAFVPGGPEPSTNGFSNFIPLTTIDRSGLCMTLLRPRGGVLARGAASHAIRRPSRAGRAPRRGTIAGRSAILRGPRSRTPDHAIDLGRHVLGLEAHVRMGAREDTKHLVREGLADRL